MLRAVPFESAGREMLVGCEAVPTKSVVLRWEWASSPHSDSRAEEGDFIAKTPCRRFSESCTVSARGSFRCGVYGKPILPVTGGLSIAQAKVNRQLVPRRRAGLYLGRTIPPQSGVWFGTTV